MCFQTNGYVSGNGEKVIKVYNVILPTAHQKATVSWEVQIADIVAMSCFVFFQ